MTTCDFNVTCSKAANNTAGKRMPDSVDPLLIEAWLRARSVSRGLPQPVSDSGGLRLDSALPNEPRRYLFARPVEGLRELAMRITGPRIPIKLCDTPETLRSYLPAHWVISPQNFVMICHRAFGQRDERPQPPAGYLLELNTADAVTEASMLTTTGELAASGYAAHYDGAFVYDRIVTRENHRRKGLGRTIMTALASARPASATQQILVATPEGRELYRSLGWSDYAPYASAVILEAGAQRDASIRSG
jgi:GNAT superfamily N-acetyltransferase